MAEVAGITRHSLAEDFWELVGARLDEHPPRFLHPRLAEEEKRREAMVTIERDKLREKLGGGRAGYEAVDPFECAVSHTVSLDRESAYICGLMDGIEFARRIDTGILPWIIDAWCPLDRTDEEETSA